MIDVLCWCPSRDTFVNGMATTYLPDGRTIATVDENGNLVPVLGVDIDEIGPIWKGGKLVDGFHANLRASGAIEKMLTQGLPQTDAKGKPLGLFERTHILHLIPGLEFKPIVAANVPAGYRGPNGVLLFDPAVVSNRARVFF